MKNKEPTENIAYLPPEKMPKPGRYASMPPDLFTGLSVKMGFKIVDKPDSYEWMWVSNVRPIYPDSPTPSYRVSDHPVVLVGTLDNVPIHDVGVNHTDIVGFNPADVVLMSTQEWIRIQYLRHLEYMRRGLWNAEMEELALKLELPPLPEMQATDEKLN